MNTDPVVLNFVSLDEVNRHEFTDLCARANVLVRLLDSIEQLPEGYREPVVYDLGGMFPDERNMMIEHLVRFAAQRPVGAYTKFVDEPIVAAMKRNAVLVSDHLDETLLDVVPAIGAAKRRAA